MSIFKIHLNHIITFLVRNHLDVKEIHQINLITLFNGMCFHVPIQKKKNCMKARI